MSALNKLANKEVSAKAGRHAHPRLRLVWPAVPQLESIVYHLFLCLAGIAALMTHLDQMASGQFSGRWFGHLTSIGQPFRFGALAFTGLACSMGLLAFAIPKLIRELKRTYVAGQPQASRSQLLEFPALRAEEVEQERFYVKHEDLHP